VGQARHAAAVGLAFVTAWTSACATYHPRAGRHITVDANGIHHRDGQDFKVGMFGDRAEALVTGNARAVEYARRYKHLNHVGLAAYLVGLATMIASPIVAQSVPESADAPIGWGGLGLGAGISIVGMALMFKGQAALIDAVNVYNDGVAGAAGVGRP
jgi:hypothetical protein